MKIKEWEIVHSTNTNHKKAEVTILVSDTAAFRTRSVTMDIERHYIMIKLSINQEYITILDSYAPKNVLKYMRQKTDKVKEK